MSVQTVLIVDDELNICRLLVRVLTKVGVRVLTADTAAAAEKLLLQNHVNLILCDHQMPGEKGLTFLGRIGDQYPDMVRTLLTGNSDFALTLESSNDNRVHHCITKPFEMDAIQKFVVDQLSRGVRQEPAQERDWRAAEQGDHRNALDSSDLALELCFTRQIGE